MNRNVFSSLLSLAMCLLLLTGCALFSRQAEENSPQDPSPEQTVTDPAPEETEIPVEPEIVPDAIEDESPSAEPESPSESESPAEPEPSVESEVDVSPEGKTDTPTDSEPTDTEDAVDTPSDEQADPAALTADELRALESWFNKWENNGLLRFPFRDLSDPTVLAPYLEFLFYDVGETSISDEECALLDAAGMYMETDIFRLGRGYVMRYLLGKFELDLSNIDMTALQSIPVPGFYLEAYDAWYICHGDVMYLPYTFDSAYRTDDAVVVTYVNPFLTICITDGQYDYLSDVKMELTLRPAPDGWRLVSHKICD